MNAWEIMPVLLLLLFSLSFTIGIGIVVAVLRRGGKKPARTKDECGACTAGQTSFQRPTCWLAVRSNNVLAVQSALGLHNPKPCSLLDGLACEEKLFIAPPIKGWILVFGSSLPDPGEDVDACFRFVQAASRKLGTVQLFSANRVLHHHAWIKAEGGRFVRAYAWAGQTLWSQGPITAAEKDLDLRCLDYFDTPDKTFSDQPDTLAVTTEKVPQLAARWSLDPACIEASALEHEGVAGEISRRY
jgi:hypothetical protein